MVRPSCVLAYGIPLAPNQRFLILQSLNLASSAEIGKMAKRPRVSYNKRKFSLVLAILTTSFVLEFFFHCYLIFVLDEHVLIFFFTHESSWESGISADFAINLDKTLLHDESDLASSKGVLQTVAKQDHQWKTFTKFVRTRWRSWCLIFLFGKQKNIEKPKLWKACFIFLFLMF